MYQELSVPTCVQGYLVVMSGQDTKIRESMAHHIECLMSDCDLYGWEKVRAFHMVLLKQMEQGRLSWTDSDQIFNFRRALVWHSHSPPPVPSTAQQAMSYTSPGPQRYHQTSGVYNASASPSIVPCEPFN